MMSLEMFGASHEIGSRELTNFHHWRKHDGLNQWMLVLFADKAETTQEQIEEAACFSVELTPQDLEYLEAVVRAVQIKDQPDASTTHDLLFIEKARQRLMKGLTVIYYANWQA
jgi:hypothetical protein